MLVRMLGAGAAGGVAGAAALAAALAMSGPGAGLHQVLRPPPAASAQVASAAAPPASFADVFDRVSPAVVSIYSTSVVSPPAIVLPPFPFGGARVLPPTRAQSSGSGFFISADGYVVTNSHVVEGAEEIEVVLRDERRLRAVVVGADRATDIAVLKVPGRGYPSVQFAQGKQPRVGDWVLAVGNPFGLGATATVGVISAYGRDIGSAFVDFLQLDAPINRGNSGGPSFDSHGRVVGVNTAIFSPTGASVGIGFAIPAEVARRVSEDLIARRPVAHGYLGAALQDLDRDLAAALGVSAADGALVASVEPGSPAARAGLQRGDVITRLNGRATGDAAAVTRSVVRTRPGEPLQLDVLRGGRSVTLTVRVGARPPEIS